MSVSFDYAPDRPEHIDTILNGLNRYNPETTTVFQDYVAQQCELQAYDCYANLALLKLYQFNPHLTKDETITNILVKALTVFPNPDFSLCLHLLPPHILTPAAATTANPAAGDAPLSEAVQKLSVLNNLLASASYAQFWATLDSDDLYADLAADTTSFEDIMRKRIAVNVRQTIREVEKPLLEGWLSLHGAEFERFVTEECGWEIHGEMVKVPLNKENEAKGTIITENVKFDQPVYLSVPSQVGFARPFIAQSQPLSSPTQSNKAKEEPEAPRKRIEWSAAVRSYVQRTFSGEHQIEGISREVIEPKLKQIITEAQMNNNLDSTDWDKFPLPQQIIQSEKVALRFNSQMQPVTAHPRLDAPNEPRNQRIDSASKKRKSTEFDHQEHDDPRPQFVPPWRKSNIRPSENRQYNQSPSKRPHKQQEESSKTPPSKFQASWNTRPGQFEDLGRHQTSYGPSSPAKLPSNETESQGPIIGRNQELLKKYFRLTAAPNPDNVRPLPVLRKTLELLKRKWKAESNYSWTCDQFKSLRQDLTVQHIKNDFTVNAYEIHARIALEKGDLGEYNQCQTQLRALYSQNLGGNPLEFKAYRILYFIHTCNRTDMNEVLADLTPTEKKDPAVRHALAARSALALGNYHRFFRLYLDTPNMGAYIEDMFVPRERLAALAKICKIYKPSVSLRFITEELGFESDSESARFICDYDGRELLQGRDDGLRLLTDQAGTLFEAAKYAAFKTVDIKGQI
ncbi:MAG: hypothetical protein M1829_002532 [Trizodia sp. TS-e1964]|nr:MAG: hypothetical protein M1829_002532 [Trizodia sp. TS-e1964]